MAEVIREKNMEVPIEMLYRAITEFDAYPDFVEEVVGVKVVSGAGTAKPRVKFELEVLKKFDYMLDFNVVSKTEIHWKLVESNFFKKNEGKWLLKEEGPKSLHATYVVDVAFGFFVPSWVTKKLTETNLPKLLENFENRAKLLAKG